MRAASLRSAAAFAVGVADPFAAGLVSAALFGRGVAAVLLPVAGAASIVYFIRRSRCGGLMDPGVPPRISPLAHAAYRLGGTVVPCMATVNPRIQVTVDRQLAAALASIEPAPASRSRLVRDLALRGAQALQVERARADDALTVLLEIADGKRDYDLEAAAEVASRRDDRLA